MGKIDQPFGCFQLDRIHYKPQRSPPDIVAKWLYKEYIRPGGGVKQI